MMIFTDGSFSRKPKVSGIGYVILTNKCEISNGCYNFKLKDNNVAEVYAIYRALQFVEKHHFDDKTIQILSDSDYALRKIKNMSLGRDELESKFLSYIQKFVQKSDKKVSFMLIKGHTHDGSKYSYYNNLADHIAGEQRLLGLQRLKNIQNKKRNDYSL